MYTKSSYSRPVLAVVVGLGLLAPLGGASAGAATAVVAQVDSVPTVPQEAGKQIKNRYIVTFDRSTPATVIAVAREAARARGGSVHFNYGHALKGFAATLPGAALSALRSNAHVLSIEADLEVQGASTTQTSTTWGLDRIDQVELPLDKGYANDATGAGVTAYVIDSGIRATHTQFGARVAKGFSAINDGKGTDDCAGHGTHVAGTIGGSTYGVAKAVTLVPVRVLDCNGRGANSRIIAGVDWVTAHHSTGAAVANMSLGGSASAALDKAVAKSIADGVTYIVSAGNSNVDACAHSPARLHAAVTVGASTPTDARWAKSNYGTCLDLFAPGSKITSAINTSDTATAIYSGTSMAAPHVAGTVATYLQNVPGAPPAAVRDVLFKAATTGLLTGVGTGSPNRLLHAVPLG